MDLVAVAIAKKYIEESLAGSGALKGAPCTIKSITPENGGNTITFEWTDSDGATQTDSMFVADGATGPQGDPGETGAKGDKGDKGDKGEPGEKGDPGPTGAQGIPGPQGVPGEKGAVGATGADGFSPIIATNPNNTEDVYKLDIIDKNGSFTTPNLVGRQGGQGIQGERGETGPEGPQGIQGIQGIKGDKGEDGYPFLIYKEYTDISEFDASHFPEIGLMFMINNGDPDANRPVYRYTGETANPYSHVTDLTTSEGLKGEKGDKGDTGEQGIQGEAGINGEDGITFTPRIGTVQGVEAMQDAAATVDVDTENKLATYNFWIPRGPAGQQGLPGEKGDPGEAGEKGADGTTYTPEIGTIETVDTALAASASIELDNDTYRAKFNFSIPKGVGIAKVEFTSSTLGDVAGIAGATDTYTIVFTDASTTTYEVYNGKDCDVQIDDENDTSENSVWSSKKTSDEIAEVEAALPNIKKFASPSGTAKYITISAHALGDIEIHSAYAGKYMFTSSGSTPVFFGTSIYRGYTLTGWAWNADNTVLYLRVNGHMDFVVSAFGSDRVTISNMATSAPDGITFNATFEINALASDIVGTKTQYRGSQSIDISTSSKLTFIYSSMYASQAGCYMLLSNYNTTPLLIELGKFPQSSFNVTATNKSFGVDTITVTTASDEYSWYLLQF